MRVNFRLKPRATGTAEEVLDAAARAAGVQLPIRDYLSISARSAEVVSLGLVAANKLAAGLKRDLRVATESVAVTEPY